MPYVLVYDTSNVQSISQVPPGKLEGLTLKLSVLDSGRVGKGKQLIGHVLLPLIELDGTAPDEEPQLYKLDIEKVSFNKQCIILALLIKFETVVSRIFFII